MSDALHLPFNRYECPRCRSGRLVKIIDLPIRLDKRFKCRACGLETELNFWPRIRSTGWGSNFEERQ